MSPVHVEALKLVAELANMPACPPDYGRFMQLRNKAADIASDPPAPMPALTQRERDALEVLSQSKKPLRTFDVAQELFVDESWAYKLLARLNKKGYARRVGKHCGGGWVSVT